MAIKQLIGALSGASVGRPISLMMLRELAQNHWDRQLGQPFRGWAFLGACPFETGQARDDPSRLAASRTTFQGDRRDQSVSEPALRIAIWPLLLTTLIVRAGFWPTLPCSRLRRCLPSVTIGNSQSTREFDVEPTTANWLSGGKMRSILPLEVRN
jgi:hypothetical protein